MKSHRRWNLRTKLICIFLCMIVLPLAIFGMALFAIQQRITESFLRQSMESSVAQLADRLNQELVNVRNLSNLYYLDEDLTAALSGQNNTPASAVALQEAASRYTACLGLLHVDVSFLDLNGNVYGSAWLPDPDRLLAAVDSNRGNAHWLSARDLGTGDCVYAVRPLHDRSNWNPVGTLVISANETELRKIYSGYLSESQNAYLLDRQGNLLSFVNNQGVDYVPDIAQCPLYYGSYLDDSLPTPQLITYHTITTNSWVLVVASNMTALRQPYATSTNLFLTVLLVYFMVTIVLSMLFANRFVRPIRQLCDNIALVKEGNLDTGVPVTSSDEIGHLSEQYNEMLLRVKELMADNMAAQQSRHEAEMQALQAQINPHFIYNSLASVRFLIFAGKNAEADRALLALINILHGTLSNPHALSTVGQEIKLLQDYIELQRISFSRTLTVEFDVDESVRNCRICKLTLQPLVENAFSHGFAASQTHCSLTVRAKDRTDLVEISIADNGGGFDTKSARPKDWGGQDGPHTGLGIANVHHRLVLAFGPAYGLTMESSPGQGTTAHIVIPKKEEEGGALIYDGSDCR